MSKVKAHKILGLSPKKKCCRKQTRCDRCPVVQMRLQRLSDQGASKKDLQKALKSARAA